MYFVEVETIVKLVALDHMAVCAIADVQHSSSCKQLLEDQVSLPIKNECLVICEANTIQRD